VIAILEAISNSVSALPVVGSPAALGSGVPASGGFAARLATAQGNAAAPQTTASEAETSEESATGSLETAASLNARMPAGNVPAKKFPGGNPSLAGNAWAGANAIVPGFVSAVANQISLPAQPNVTETSVPAQSSISNGASGIVQQAELQQPGTQTSAYRAVAKDASLSYSDHSAPSLVVGTFGALVNPSGTEGVQTNSQANGQEAAPVHVAQLPVLSATVGGTDSGGAAGAPSATPENQWNGIQPSILSNSIVSPNAQSASGAVAGPALAENILLSENTPPSALSTANAQPPSTTGWQDAVPATPSSGSPVDGMGNGTAEPFAQAAPTEPTLLAGANSTAGAGVRAQRSAGADIAISQADSTSAIAPTADQIDPSAQTGTGNGLSGILSGAVAALPGLNPAAQLAPVRSMPRVAAARTTAVATSTGVRTAGAASPAATLASSLTTEAGNGSAAASQTPFSIFFSSPGPGTESAASTLPKMILPATSSTIRDSHIGAADASGVSAPSGGAHGGLSTSNIAQNAAPPNSGDTNAGQSGSLSLSSSTAQALHADPAAATAAVAVAPAAAAPSPTAAGSAGATLPLIQPTASSADALPKPGTPAGNAGTPTTPLPAAAEPAAATVAGPVQMAQMVSRVGQAEMRIGVNTSAFGSVEVRTVVHANDVGLTIGSEKGDLRGLLGNEMPAITNSLQQQNLRLSSVNFTQEFASSGNGSGGGNSQQRSFVPAVPAPASSSSNSVSSEVAGNDFADLPPLGIFSGGSGSLSILA
jgi:hypothetical protein